MLNELQTSPGAVRKPKRKGRGPGSTLGKTAGRGQKGQYARNTVRRGFEGGQTPLHRRLPRRGFTNFFRTVYTVVNLKDLAKNDKVGKLKEIDPQAMLETGLVSNLNQPIKVLGDGDLKQALTVKAHKFSKSSIDKITAAGGQAIVLEA